MIRKGSGPAPRLRRDASTAPGPRLSGSIAGLAKSPRLGQSRDAAVIIAERFAQHLVRMLTKQRCGHGIDGRRQAHMERRFDVRHGARGWMRNLAEAVAIAHLRRIEALFNSAEI